MLPVIQQPDPLPTTLDFQCVKGNENMVRARIFGGWLILHDTGYQVPPIFIPDPNHQWKLEPC